MDLNSARIFAYVVVKGSFTAAAKQLNMPVATVSRKVAELEKSLNLRLLERSTRKLRVTESGTILYEYVSRGLKEMESGLAALTEQEENLKGILRLSLPPNFEPWWQLLTEFQQQYPNIEIDLFSSEQKLDLIEEEIDVALRVGKVETLSCIARSLTFYRHKLIATPEFISTHGMPKSPDDLANFPCSFWGKRGTKVEWRLGKHRIDIKPVIRSNDYLHVRSLALNHQCITEVPYFLAEEYLKSGELIELLPEHPMPMQELSLIYPSYKQLSKIARAYIDFCLYKYDLTFLSDITQELFPKQKEPIKVN